MCSLRCYGDTGRPGDSQHLSTPMRIPGEPSQGGRKTTKKRLTVRTSVGLQPEPDPPAGVPVQRNEAEESSDGWLLQLVLNHAVCITVTWKRLKTHKHMYRGFMKSGFHQNTARISENTVNSGTIMQFSCVHTLFLQGLFLFVIVDI